MDGILIKKEGRKMSGFIYIWRDKKRKRYYIGSHIGTEDDGYICSSTWMKQNYKKHPEYFKRKILEYVDDKSKMMEREYYWLSMIKQEELGKRYYNKTNYKNGHWIFDEDKKILVAQKISKANTGRKHKNRKPVSEETKKKLSVALKGKSITYERSEETRKKISENTKRLQKEGKIGMKGRKHSVETKRKMRENNAMKNPEYRNRVSMGKRGLL
jgi:hypothetical protein